MPRVKRGTSHVKKRKSLLKKVKGYKWGRKNLPKLAKVAALKAGVYAYRDRRNKKRSFRGLWLVKISAYLKQRGLSYSKFIDSLKKNKIEIDRKILAELAEKHPQILDKIIKELK